MTADRLARRLGTRQAVVVGLSAMIGAGVFTAFAPAAAAAGAALPIALLVAGVVAYCNATSSARLAVRYPDSGGTYVYGRERLGPFWGYLAGWGFVVGKTASCAAMALTVVAYAAPNLEGPWPGLLAAAVVAALTLLNYHGVQRSARAAAVLVTISLLVLAAAVVAVFAAGEPDAGGLDVTVGTGPLGVLQAAGLLFFAFAGYARIATLAEEVRDPERTIPRAVTWALGLVLAVYAAVALALLVQLGPDGIADAQDPVAEAVASTGLTALVPVVRIGAVLAALGALLALVLGVSRTVLAMSRDRHLPHGLAAVHPRHGVPHRAEVVVGIVVALVAATVDLRGAIGFSSFAVLVYYAVANASAFTLGRRIVPVVGLTGCVLLAATLPTVSVLSGLAVLAAGTLAYALRRR
ncbi:APC family permease [Prauserella rugosa]|uniref:APA family basic amino acid/polyamine antiporter n=1 Tax=Prauserella rugosa TaxID=43354 RepID=A0A660C9M3_9PSEU|nr:APC family permease [Prauserella rugosa]KMS86801.1 transporter [Streptomyces regensis]TWH19044.1 APA family basic amino acid/polyamine antiporter [Prauserella rugosa]